MPIYSYKCSKCGHAYDEVRIIARRNASVKCAKCKRGRMQRTVESPGSTDLPYDKPIYSDGAGVHPKQVARHRQLFPNIPITDDGQVVFTSHHQRKRALKELGLIDRDGY